METIKNKIPAIFISYSWDNEDHKSWVLKLADRLGNDGIDVFLDRYELRLGSNLTAFIENAIKNSDRIIILFTPNYKSKAQNRNSGVGYEYSIINTGIYDDILKNKKIIPILRSGNVKDSIPDFMQQFIHLDLSNDKNFEEAYKNLLREIYDEPEVVKPQLGKKPEFKLTSINTTYDSEKNSNSHKITERDNNNIIDIPTALLLLHKKLKELRLIEEKTSSEKRAEIFLTQELTTEVVKWRTEESSKYIPQPILDLEIELEKTRQKKNDVTKYQKFEEASSLRGIEKRLEEEIALIKDDWLNDFSSKNKLRSIAILEEQLENLQKEKQDIIKRQKFDEIILIYEKEEKVEYELKLAKENWLEIISLLFSSNLQNIVEESFAKIMGKNASIQTTKALSYSREEALRLGNDFIGVEHLLLGIICATNSMALKILQDMRVDTYGLRRELELAIKDTNHAPRTNVNSLPLTKHAEKVFRLAVLEAVSLKSSILETNHIMLSILKTPESAATQILFRYYVDYYQYKQQLSLNKQTET